MNDLNNADTLYNFAYIYQRLSSEYLTLDLITMGEDHTARINAKSYEMKAKKIEELIAYCDKYESADDELDIDGIEEAIDKINKATKANNKIIIDTPENKIADMYYTLKNSVIELCDKFENEIKNYN